MQHFWLFPIHKDPKDKSILVITRTIISNTNFFSWIWEKHFVVLRLAKLSKYSLSQYEWLLSAIWSWLAKWKVLTNFFVVVVLVVLVAAVVVLLFIWTAALSFRNHDSIGMPKSTIWVWSFHVLINVLYRLPDISMSYWPFSVNPH